MKLSLVVLGIASLVVLGSASAEGSRVDVLERIKPVGQLNIEGQVAKPVAEVAAKPAAPVEEVKPAVAPVTEPIAPVTEPIAPVAEPAVVVASTAEPVAVAAVSNVGEGIYNKSCLMCHASGVANAPIVGKAAMWAPRIAKGMDVLVQSAIKGMPGTAMQPRGTCVSCSDDDLRAVVEFMVSKSQ